MGDQLHPLNGEATLAQRHESTDATGATPPESTAGAWFSWMRLREVGPYLGPAILVSVGYMDPGNWGTNIAAGSDFGYTLLWVLLVSNVMAIFLQSLSAKLGIATGHTLAQCCRQEFGRRTSIFLWLTAEGAAMATDLAEFLGAALGFYILFNIPLFAAGILTGFAVFLILGLYRFGYRSVELLILGFVSIIGLAYVIEVWLAQPDWGQVAGGVLIPRVSSQSILIAVGMLGATVMPHNIFLHSAVVQTRVLRAGQLSDQIKRRLFGFAVVDSLLALNAAWVINSAMIIVAAAVFFHQGTPVGSIVEAHRTLAPALGALSSLAFAIGLLSAGLSSSVTGTMAGQTIMEGFLQRRIPIWLRRLITMVPALVVIALGLPEILVLVVSQAVLSLQLPFTIIPLILLTNKERLMGNFANGRITSTAAWAIALIIIALNLLLLFQTFGGSF
ncbi:MAG: Nramp family divalent metal transporter [Chloroflexi bacterium]|nr:Nramp family divalent metal transporter [Chloroflexota bacterium]